MIGLIFQATSTFPDLSSISAPSRFLVVAAKPPVPVSKVTDSWEWLAWLPHWTSMDTCLFAGCMVLNQEVAVRYAKTDDALASVQRCQSSQAPSLDFTSRGECS